MKSQLFLTVVCVILGLANSYSKYGRTCKDIGCTTHEVCVMAEDPCRHRDEPCGMYPTCQKIANHVSSCATFFCPPTTVCKQDGDTPKCIDDNGASAHNGNPYETKPSAPEPVGPGLYPQVPRGQTTTRPPIYRPGGSSSGGGYQGGSIGSGYPGQPSNGYPGYPTNNNNNNNRGGYSGYPGYPSQGGAAGYPGQNGYPGYPGQNGYSGQSGYPGYPQNGYPGGYQSNYPYGNNQNTYGTNPYAQRPGSSSGSSSDSNKIYDKVTDTLKNIGLFCIIILNFTATVNRVY